MLNPKILVANRGEITCRIFKTCKALGFTTYAIYSEVDSSSLHVSQADHAIQLPSGPLCENYLNKELIIKIALEHKIMAIHPGYGFLSESWEFAEMIENAGLIWIGPTSKNIQDLACKHITKSYALKFNVPTCPNSPFVDSP